MIGPGKYDVVCTAARVLAEAKGAIVIIIQGNEGNGFSVQLPPDYAERIPRVLREVADGIEADLKQRVDKSDN